VRGVHVLATLEQLPHRVAIAFHRGIGDGRCRRREHC
jgi:hypothetical protein